jgi:hypothetical protein
MYKIRIFSDFCDSTKCKTIIESNAILYKLDYGINRTLFITDTDDYTHVIILNTAMPQIRPDIPKENVIGFAYEPLVYLPLTLQFIAYAQKNINKYYVGDIANLPKPFIEGNCYLYYNNPVLPIPISPILTTNNRISIMISQKLHQPGHVYRHSLTGAILKTNLPVDIYGRGCGYYKTDDSRLKGGFEKYEPYNGYDFHICIENVQSEHYFSEKIINTFIAGATPIYLGCKNIDSYFPDQVLHLSGDINEDIQIITNIVREPHRYRKQIDIEKTVDKVSLLHNIIELYNE